MSGFQPSPSRATPGFRHGGHGIVKPRPWPPSDTRPPTGGVVPFQTDRHIAPLLEDDARPRVSPSCQDTDSVLITCTADAKADSSRASNDNIPTLYSAFRCVWLGHVKLARAVISGAISSPSVLICRVPNPQCADMDDCSETSFLISKASKATCPNDHRRTYLNQVSCRSKLISVGAQKVSEGLMRRDDLIYWPCGDGFRVADQD